MAAEVHEVTFTAKAVWLRPDEGFGVDEAKEAEVVGAIFSVPAFEGVEVKDFKVSKVESGPEKASKSKK